VGSNPVNGHDPLGLAIVQCNCVTTCTTSTGPGDERSTTCERTCETCVIGNSGAGGTDGAGGDIPGPVGGSRGTGSTQPKPPPPRPPTEQQEQCDLCYEQFQNDLKKAVRNGEAAFEIATSVGVLTGVGPGL
jgi:hypothetical protein